MRDETGDHIANVLVAMNTEGVVQLGDWDALGMRASGSQSIQFEDCEIPHDALRKLAPWGQWSTPILVNRTLANVPLVGAFLGIAETAFQYAIDAQPTSKPPAQSPAQSRAQSPALTVKSPSGVHHAVAEMEIMLATAQSILARMGARLDDFMAATNGGTTATYEQGHELMKDYQSAKWVANRHAIDIVSLAMDLCGGGGYTARNPLSRLYRDVRAGPFMQPYSPIDAREYMGKVLLGEYPAA
jgi:alkylation response protein AidB-like acyl-CoA dehydrogenase